MITFKDIATRMIELQQRKNHDYGNAFHDSFNEFGPVAAVVRLNDKNNRIKNLYNRWGTQQIDESLCDTLIDMAAYAIMTVVELENMNGEKEIPCDR